MMKIYEQCPEGYSSHVYCEGLETEEADEGYRILEETKDKLDSQRPILQRSFDI